MLDRKKISLIHVAKNKLGLKDYEYREILQSVCKVESSRDIKSEWQFKNLIKVFKRLGFKPDKVKTYDHRNDPGDRAVEWASPEQLDKIVVMWKHVTNGPLAKWEATLHGFLKKRFRIDHRRFLKRDQAVPVIEAIKKMYLRKILKTSFVKSHKGGDVVENKLLELFSLVQKNYTWEELALMITVEIYGDPDAKDRFRETFKVMQEMQFRKFYYD